MILLEGIGFEAHHPYFDSGAEADYLLGNNVAEDAGGGVGEVDYLYHVGVFGLVGQ